MIVAVDLGDAEQGMFAAYLLHSTQSNAKNGLYASTTSCLGGRGAKSLADSNKKNRGCAIRHTLYGSYRIVDITSLL